VVGYERFAFTGPLIPEPVFGFAGALALGLVRRR
jgi:hypothetical protein